MGTGAPFCAHSPCFEEEEHFRVLVKMAAQELSNGVPDSGHLYASICASRTLTPAGDLQETFSGMEQVPNRGEVGYCALAGQSESLLCPGATFTSQKS